MLHFPTFLSLSTGGGLVAERQIPRDTINTCWIDEHGRSQRSPAFGTFGLKQVAFAGAPAQNLPVAVILKRWATAFLVLIPLGRRIEVNNP